MNDRFPPPTAQGNLTKTPFCHLVVYMADKALTGTIALDSSAPPAEHRVYFRQGGMTKVRTWKVDADGGGVGAGHPDALQVLVALVCTLSDCQYRYYENLDLLPDEPERPALDPLRIIGSIGNSGTPPAVVDALLAKLGHRALRLHPQSEIGRFGWGSSELAVASRIRDRAGPFSELVASGVASEATIRNVVYALLITRHLDHGTGAPPTALRWRSENDDTGAAALTPDLVMRRDAILSRAEAMDREDYFTILGVGRKASPTEIQNAYFALAKVWHTDRLPLALSDLREPATKIFSRMTEAFETLSDPDRRARYLSTLDLTPPGADVRDEEVRVQRVLEAASNFQKAEILLKKRDYANAETLAAAALAADPDQSDYVALHVAIRAVRRSDPVADVSDLIAELDRAIARDERCERAYFIRATLNKRAGRLTAAIHDFRRAAELNPRNVDAMREVRIYDMRSGRNPSGTPPRSGEVAAEKKDRDLFGGLGKLFKK